MTLKKKVEALEAEIAELKKKSCSCNHCPTCGRSFVPYWPYGWTYYTYPNMYYGTGNLGTGGINCGISQSEPCTITTSATGGMTLGSIQ